MSGYVAANKIREAVQPLGAVQMFKAYLDVNLQFTKVVQHSELQSSGVSLIHTPHNAKKEVADKILLADLIMFALEGEGLSSIVLISGDRDFSYAVSSLRCRGHGIFFISPPSSTHHSLEFLADGIFDWRADILERKDPSFKIRALLNKRPHLLSSGSLDASICTRRSLLSRPRKGSSWDSQLSGNTLVDSEPLYPDIDLSVPGEHTNDVIGSWEDNAAAFFGEGLASNHTEYTCISQPASHEKDVDPDPETASIGWASIEEEENYMTQSVAAQVSSAVPDIEYSKSAASLLQSPPALSERELYPQDDQARERIPLASAVSDIPCTSSDENVLDDARDGFDDVNQQNIGAGAGEAELDKISSESSQERLVDTLETVICSPTATATSSPTPAKCRNPYLSNLCVINIPDDTAISASFTTKGSSPKADVSIFATLVEAMEQESVHGNISIAYTSLGSLLLQANPNVYIGARVAGLKEYLELAQLADIVSFFGVNWETREGCIFFNDKHVRQLRNMGFLDSQYQPIRSEVTPAVEPRPPTPKSRNPSTLIPYFPEVSTWHLCGLDGLRSESVSDSGRCSSWGSSRLPSIPRSPPPVPRTPSPHQPFIPTTPVSKSVVSILAPLHLPVKTASPMGPSMTSSTPTTKTPTKSPVSSTMSQGAVLTPSSESPAHGIQVPSQPTVSSASEAEVPTASPVSVAKAAASTQTPSTKSISASQVASSTQTHSVAPITKVSVSNPPSFSASSTANPTPPPVPSSSTAAVSKTPPKVGSEFVNLVKILRDAHSSGKCSIERSQLTQLLREVYPALRTGKKGPSKLVKRAEAAGIIRLNETTARLLPIYHAI
ncbi:hypothetical protein EW145_g680 [Phellinidium pouzarii]|uniref:NYN domain-containing protein n=1 Tax=Phellinidium pouzarii TaxID=167371 RepID=A0A4S4LJ20_9AGAM|nr:hypothetical protein EW145_g680 [Phellinidium pouzarii]